MTTNTDGTGVHLIADPTELMDEEFHGIALACISEDGELLALGHHDTAQVIKAVGAYQRQVVGDTAWITDADPGGVAWPGALTPAHAVFHHPRPGRDDETDLAWVVRRVHQDTPGAHPVMFISPWMYVDS